MREIKFRAFNHVANRMYIDGKAGDVFKWKNEGQIQTIMQYTGLKDKNGKEIYEGDICILNRSSWVSGNFQAEGTIEWYFDRFQWKRLPKYDGDENNGIWPTCEIFARCTWIEIIGNIYENPELLTK